MTDTANCADYCASCLLDCSQNVGAVEVVIDVQADVAGSAPCFVRLQQQANSAFGTWDPDEDDAFIPKHLFQIEDVAIEVGCLLEIVYRQDELEGIDFGH